MKVVLFCGGLGTRIREYSESVPKPMIPIGHQPILWHVMNYYSQYGHKDFVLCLGYKANTVKEFFLNYKTQTYGDVIVEGSKVELLGPRQEDWRVAMIDTGVWRNIGSRLWAVRDHVKNEEMFLANYSDGLSDAPLPLSVTAPTDRHEPTRPIEHPLENPPWQTPCASARRWPVTRPRSESS